MAHNLHIVARSIKVDDRIVVGTQEHLVVQTARLLDKVALVLAPPVGTDRDSIIMMMHETTAITVTATQV